ncbi:MAG: nucleotidyltransferase domain-containing protein [Deltaproteobacteria bacterium]|nr:nucleotidyltransferase domain-containing protein [Deltaproteobacteria bacterium]
MPKRLLNSPVLKWPDAQTVIEELHRWAKQVLQQRQDVNRIGFFGSYARGNDGVGSDLDLIIIIDHSDDPFERRGVAWDMTKLPVPADLLVYTKEEWQSLDPNRRFNKMLMKETVWIYTRGNDLDP